MVLSRRFRPAVSPITTRMWAKSQKVPDAITSVGRGSAEQECVLHAIIGTWQEEDVVEATVNNCFANGCSKVYVLDNASEDSTVDLATGAGALIAEIYKTDFYDDDLRLFKTNEHIKKVIAEDGVSNVWWLGLDCDEFPCGPNGEKLIDFLSTLDPRCNIVPSRYVDLYPTSKPHYARNRHPADYQSMCVNRFRDNRMGKNLYWKHPLVRANGLDWEIQYSRGIHVPIVPTNYNKHVYVSEIPINTFHAPYREEGPTRNRLNLLCKSNAAFKTRQRSELDDTKIRKQGPAKKIKALNAIYAGRWEDVTLPHSQVYGMDIVGIALYPWQKFLSCKNGYTKWYDDGVKADAGSVKKGCLSLPVV